MVYNLPTLNSPAIQATLTAPPLSALPDHLLADPALISTIHALKDAIHVETHFYID